MRSWSQTSALVLFLLLSGSPHKADASSVDLLPEPVSPGAAKRAAAISSNCPTFTWTAAAGSNGSRLAIWKVDEKGEISEPAHEVEVRGDARAWTPSGEECLEPGRTYAWQVRSDGEWSDPLLVRVVGGAWLDELLEDLVFELLESRAEDLALRSSLPSLYQTRQVRLREAPLHATGGASLHIETNNFYGLWASGESQGIFASASAVDGRGVYGEVTGSSGTIAGVTGLTDSTTGRGVYGLGETHGVLGMSDTTTGVGVQGIQSGAYVSLQGSGCGVDAQTSSDAGRGLTGLATSSSGTNYGVFGASSYSSGWDFFAAGSGSYAPFTGAHEVRLDGDPAAFRPGLVVAVTGSAEVRRGSRGEVALSSTLPSVDLARRAFDPAVLGVFVSRLELPPDHWTENREGEFGGVNALGEGRVWVTDANGPVAAGDYLTTSDIPGFAQRQGDGVHRAYTLGKATETIDWQAVGETIVHQGCSHRAALIAVVYTSG